MSYKLLHLSSEKSEKTQKDAQIDGLVTTV